MSFTRTQSILKILLPKRVFGFLYVRAWWAYVLRYKISDEIGYLRSYMYYVLTRDLRNATKWKTIHSIKSYSLVSRAGLSNAYDLSMEIEKNKIEGCFVECGVARGGCSALMAMVAAKNKSNRKVWLFDSFEGLPELTIEDEDTMNENLMGENKHSGLLAKGFCLGTYDEVEKLLFPKLSLDRDNVFMVKGWFQDTLPKYKDKVGAISILRIDADYYDSTKCCLENLYDNVKIGGCIIIDDYGAQLGCKKAVDKFLKERELNVKLVVVNWTVHYFIKPY